MGERYGVGVEVDGSIYLMLLYHGITTVFLH